MKKCLAESIGFPPLRRQLADAMKIGLRNQRQEVTYFEAAKRQNVALAAEEMKRPDYNLGKSGKVRPAACTATSRWRRVTSR